jgi:hypothetical protein
MSSRHAHVVRDRVRTRWPERYQSMPLARALGMLHRSGRIYHDEKLWDMRAGTSVPALGARARSEADAPVTPVCRA